MWMGQEGGGHAPDIFLSYSRVDEVHAVRLMEFLQASGFSVWWDGMLEAGTVFTSKTEQALNDAKAVVVLWSPRSVDSNWVRDEAQAARDDGRLVPVSIEGAKPPLGFRQFQSVDLSAWTGDPGAPEARNVRDSVARLVGKSVEPAMAITTAGYRSPTTPASIKAGRGSWAVAAIAALLLVAGALFAFKQLAKAEYARIGRYYATESMLVLDHGQYSPEATPEAGSDTLRDHYRRSLGIAVHAGPDTLGPDAELPRCSTESIGQVEP